MDVKHSLRIFLTRALNILKEQHCDGFCLHFRIFLSLRTKMFKWLERAVAQPVDPRKCNFDNLTFVSIGFTKPKPPACLEALGMQDGKIPDSAITASTEYNAQHKAINGRLHFLYRSGRIGAWAAQRNDVYQYLQVNFGDWTKVSRVAIQGRSDANQWVKSFSLSYGYDHVFFKDYKEDGSRKVSCHSE